MGHVRVQLRNVEHLLRSENLTMKGKPLFLCAPLRFQFHNQLSSLMDKLTTASDGPVSSLQQVLRFQTQRCSHCRAPLAVQAGARSSLGHRRPRAEPEPMMWKQYIFLRRVPSLDRFKLLRWMAYGCALVSPRLSNR
jgi:hypothetical protein